MSRGMKWIPFFKAPQHTINSEWLVCMDNKGTMHRATFADGVFKTLAGEPIDKVSVYINDKAVCKVIDEVAEAAKQEARDAVAEAMDIVSRAQDQKK